MKLVNDTGRVTEWFKLNSMVANPDKLQLMFLKVKTKSKMSCHQRHVCYKRK